MKIYKNEEESMEDNRLMKTTLNEALEIIDDLLETINWLGGDAYEMDAINDSVDKAQRFFDAHDYATINKKKSKKQKQHY
jgi:hypothetical protein